MASPIRPPFSEETARAKVQAAEDASSSNLLPKLGVVFFDKRRFLQNALHVRGWYHNGAAGRGMAVSDPFRRYFIYPPLIRRVEQAWRSTRLRNSLDCELSRPRRREVAAQD